MKSVFAIAEDELDLEDLMQKLSAVSLPVKDSQKPIGVCEEPIAHVDSHWDIPHTDGHMDVP